MKSRSQSVRLWGACVGCWLVACAHPVDDIVSEDDTSYPNPSGGRAHAGSGGKAGNAAAGKSSLPLAGTSAGGSVGAEPVAGRTGSAAGDVGAGGVGQAGEPSESRGGQGSVNVPAELQVLHKTGSGDASDNQIRVALRVASAASSGVELSALELRYYFTSEVALPLVVEVYDAAITGASGYRSVAKEALKAEVTGADAYLKISFADAAGALDSGDAITLDVSVHGPNWTGNFAEADDYSFAAGHGEFTAWDHVTLFGEAKLLWGIEPP